MNILWNGKPVEYWAHALHDADEVLRWQAVDALRHLARPEQSLDLLIEALSDRCWRVRALAAHSIYDMAHQEELLPRLTQAVEPLAGVLSDEILDVSVNAAYALELLGPIAVPALPRLRAAAQHRDDRLRQAASDAIAKISC